MSHTRKIIIADPDPAQGQTVMRHAEDTGLDYAFAPAANVAEVRRLLHGTQPDLLIAEYLFPDGDVFDILHMSTQPVIVLTASGSERIAVATLNAGAADYVIKDPEYQHLQLLPQAIARAFESSRQRSRQSQFETLTHAIMSINDSVFITDMQDSVIFVNKAFCSTYGYQEQDILGCHVSLFWQDRSPDATPRQDGSMAEDVRHTRKDGSQFPVSLTRSMVFDEHKQAFAVVGVARDISERIQTEQRLKASLSEKEILLREIHHRVKNNLQIISSLLNLQAGYIHDPQTSEALRDSQNRVKSMALIHERLYRSETLTKVDFAAYVQSLVEHVRSSFRNTSNLDIAVQGNALDVDVDLAVPCGLIVNELLTNAIKHAFPQTRSGRIDISMAITSAPDDYVKQLLQLQVRDNGVGLPQGVEPDSVQTLGLQLITMLTQQLKGQVRFEHHQGLLCTVNVPLP